MSISNTYKDTAYWNCIKHVVQGILDYAGRHFQIFSDCENTANCGNFLVTEQGINNINFEYNTPINDGNFARFVLCQRSKYYV